VLSEPKARLTEWLSTDYNINAPERGGRAADTAHTQLGRPAHEAPTREYTHKHTQTHTNTQRGPTNKVRCGLTPWRRPLTHQRRAPRSLAPTPSELHHCRDLPRRNYVCAPPPKGAVPAARATSTSTSFSFCRWVSLFRTLSCIRRSEELELPPLAPAAYRSRRAASASPCPSATARLVLRLVTVRDPVGDYS
jgi:hypothetical protein